MQLQIGEAMACACCVSVCFSIFSFFTKKKINFNFSYFIYSLWPNTILCIIWFPSFTSLCVGILKERERESWGPLFLLISWFAIFIKLLFCSSFGLLMNFSNLLELIFWCSNINGVFLFFFYPPLCVPLLFTPKCSSR